MAKAAKEKKDDFLKNIAALAADLRQHIESAVDGFSDSPTERQERIDTARTDFGYFCRTYFPHYVSGSASQFHAWLFEKLPRLVKRPAGIPGERLAIAAPRGNAKTTYGQLFFLWCIVFKYRKYLCFMSDAFEQAAEILEGVKVELEANPRLLADFPDATGPGRIWKVGVILTMNGIKVQSFGSGKRLRGVRHGAQRPDTVWLDDLENDENVTTPAQRDKLENWIDKAIEPLGPPDGSMDIVYVGTILHYDAVLARKMRNPMWKSEKFKAVMRWPERRDLWDKWEEALRNQGPEVAETFYLEHQSTMDAGAVVLWPDMQPFYRLMLIRVRIGSSAFDCEYLNDPVSGEHAIFTNITFWVERLSNWLFYGSCDPSMGKGGRRDPSAILVGGFNRDKGVLDVVEASIRHRLPDRIIEDIIEFHREYRCRVWAFEIVQFQEFVRLELIKRSAERGLAVPARGVRPHENKELRIERLQPHIANGLIRLHSTQTALYDQLRHYPKADHDDGPDGLEMLWAETQRAFRVGGSIKRNTGYRSPSRYTGFR